MALYDAFISYSHAKDKPIAARAAVNDPKAGQAVVPAAGRCACFATTPACRPRRICGRWIEQTLGQSRYFLLLASPEAAASKSVNKEAIHWIEHNSIDTVLIALTHGELFWDEASDDFAPESEAIPLPLALAKRFHAASRNGWTCAHIAKAPTNATPSSPSLPPTLRQRSTALPKEDLLVPGSAPAARRAHAGLVGRCLTHCLGGARHVAMAHGR